MADIYDKDKRSKIMGLVKSKNTIPEVLLRKKLHANGFRFRIHDNKLPGKPDIKLTQYNTVIFVNGCFWHAHSNCKSYTIPKTNVDYWTNKIKYNAQRDLENYNKLIDLGWNIIIVWTCQLKKTSINKLTTNLANNLRSFKENRLFSQIIEIAF